MKYTSCIHLEHGITFYSTSVQICCISSHPGGGDIVQIPNYKGELIDWKDFFEQRNKMRTAIRGGVIPEKCTGCYYLTENDWNTDDYIDEVLIGHFTYCNCNCIYCYTETDKKFFNSNKTYNVYPVIKDMIEKGVPIITVRKLEKRAIEGDTLEEQKDFFSSRYLKFTMFLDAYEKEMINKYRNGI